MLIEKYYDIAGIDYTNSRLRINSISWDVETKHYNVKVTIDTGKNLCIVTCNKPNWSINIPGLRNRVVEVQDVMEQYIETYRPFFIGPLRKRVVNSWVELKEQKPVTYTSNCFIIIE